MRPWLLAAILTLAVLAPACEGASGGVGVSPSTTPSTFPATPSTSQAPSPVTVVDRIRVADQPDPVLFVDDSIWVGHYDANGMERIDPTTGRVVGKISVRSPIDLVEAFGSIWVAELNSDTVARVDPATNEILDRSRSVPTRTASPRGSAPSGP